MLEADVDRDPIAQLGQRLLREGRADEALLGQLREQVESEVESALAVAQAAPPAGQSGLGLEDVYA